MARCWTHRKRPPRRAPAEFGHSREGGLPTWGRQPIDWGRRSIGTNLRGRKERNDERTSNRLINITRNAAASLSRLPPPNLTVEGTCLSPSVAPYAAQIPAEGETTLQTGADQPCVQGANLPVKKEEIERPFRGQ